MFVMAEAPMAIPMIAFTREFEGLSRLGDPPGDAAAGERPAR